MALPKFDKLRPRERWGLLAALACVTLLLVDQLVVSAVNNKLAQLDDEIAREEERMRLNAGILSTAPALDARYEALAGGLAADLAPGDAIGGLKRVVYDMASAAGVDVVSMDPPVGTYGVCAEYRITVKQFKASMEQVIDLAARVWSAPGVLRIVRLTVTPARQGEGVEGALVLNQLVLGAPPAEASAEEP